MHFFLGPCPYLAGAASYISRPNEFDSNWVFNSTIVS